ncbi:GNAT family N-acetyltransferase [Fulvivirga sp. 29W222]|uniref:GNAT family N-acetyltransferase n=1 Tax=Fulvivirga marina TaxID=2494733 RepID=A0A937KDQ2_9BACT|nr:GNAT family N-acetyltransferase [Fulvivirga marina]MBL6448699.1 GNAT family N-acetyltransferase [Fulvivirga marina]
MNNIYIGECSIEEIIAIANQIPEFENSYPISEYKKRLSQVPFLALKAAVDDKDAGFKLGYELNDDTFYTWFGGVLPFYRQIGLADQMATAQEGWAKARGYKRIKLKTRNYLKPMLIFALKSGFNITAIEERPDINQNRIILQKEL